MQKHLWGHFCSRKGWQLLTAWQNHNLTSQELNDKKMLFLKKCEKREPLSSNIQYERLGRCGHLNLNIRSQCFYIIGLKMAIANGSNWQGWKPIHFTFSHCWPPPSNGNSIAERKFGGKKVTITYDFDVLFLSIFRIWRICETSLGCRYLFCC